MSEFDPPEFYCPDTTRCAHCGETLPLDPQPDTPAFRGFCNRGCENGSTDVAKSRTDFARHVLGSEVVLERGETDLHAKRVALVQKAIYRSTQCGAFVNLDSSEEISFGSIVEGCDYGTETHTLTFPFRMALFYTELQEVEDEARQIWNDTHGCEHPECADDSCTHCYENEETGARAVHPGCPHCEGEGVVI
jgi:hypothetical protein